MNEQILKVMPEGPPKAPEIKKKHALDGLKKTHVFFGIAFTQIASKENPN